MINEVYKNRQLYYEMMKSFLHKKISAWVFRKQYMRQRDNDLDQESKNGYTSEVYEDKIENLINNEKIFKEKYYDVLYEEGAAKLKDYEQGAKELNIKGEWFFMGLWDFIDIHIIEYYPSDDEGFDPRTNVDEAALTKRIQLAYDVLERNKDRWEWDKTEGIKR